MKRPNSASSVNTAEAERKPGGGRSEGTCGRPKRMPQGWEPPYPAWSAEFAAGISEVCVAYFGAQLRGGGDGYGRVINQFFSSGNGPDNVESGRFTDRAGFETTIIVAYWASPGRYDAWQGASGFHDWWLHPTRTLESCGYFREVLRIPLERLETLFSSENLVGVARTGQKIGQPVREHAYWGAMRDRIPESAHNDLSSSYGETLPRLGGAVTEGQRIRVVVPENLAVIRSGQNWTDCGEAELRTYQEMVYPVLINGMEFLRDHPWDTGCCDMRFINEVEADGRPLMKSYGLGYFLTLGHLERWAASHPTHLEIFGRFMDMVKKHNFQLDLKLWHEVSVLPGAGQAFEYINCHPRTGLLPYFHWEPF
jgi:aldoxime dehydratase